MKTDAVGDNTAFVSSVPLCPWSPSKAWLRSIHRAAVRRRLGEGSGGTRGVGGGGGATCACGVCESAEVLVLWRLKAAVSSTAGEVHRSDLYLPTTSLSSLKANMRSSVGSSSTCLCFISTASYTLAQRICECDRPRLAVFSRTVRP